MSKENNVFPFPANGPQAIKVVTESKLPWFLSVVFNGFVLCATVTAVAAIYGCKGCVWLGDKYNRLKARRAMSAWKRKLKLRERKHERRRSEKDE